MTERIEKVTAFVTRRHASGNELLLFQHPHAGIQIPAGTVEPRESPADAVLREASEETGLSDFSIVRSLGWRDELLALPHRVIAKDTTVYSRPDVASFDFARLPRGFQVKVGRQDGEFTQVTYRETDQALNPQYVSYQITGWVPHQALTTSRRRHFYQLACAQPREGRWTVDIDYHRFTLFWAPLNDLPEIIFSQTQWLSMLPLTE